MKFHEILEDNSKRSQDSTFLFEAAESINYGEANRIIDNITANLIALGVRKGDRVAMFSPNSIKYFLVAFGVYKSGAIASMVDIRNADTLSYFVNDMKANVLLYASELTESIATNREKMLGIKHFVCLDDNYDSMTWKDLTVSRPSCELPEIDDQDPAHLSYTSGSTGKPKGVLLAHGPTARAANCIAERLSYTSQDVILCPTSLSSSYRLVASDLPGLHRGSSIGLMRMWNPYLALDIINQRKVTVLVGNPIILKDLLDAATNDGRICSSLRMVVSGGGPVYRSLKEDYQKYFKIPLVESFGQSELGGFFCLGYPKMVYGEKITSIGPPLPDKEVRIFDENDKEVPVGKPGEIVLRGGFMLGYWQRPEETAYALRNGWLHSGDIATMDENRYIHMLGRTSERIKLGKLIVYPRMLEESLSYHPLIRQVAVIAVPDKELGEVTKAYVSLASGCKVTEGELLNFARKTLGEQAPRIIEIVDQMPMTPTGKISKLVLKANEKYRK